MKGKAPTSANDRVPIDRKNSPNDVMNNEAIQNSYNNNNNMNIHDGNSANAFENTDPYMQNQLNRNDNQNLNSMSVSQNNEASQPSLNSNSARE